MTYSLGHGPLLRAAAPYTFFLPHPWLIRALEVGDLAKLPFEYDPPGEKYGGERMWVEIQTIKGQEFRGHLVNDPDDPKAPIAYGDAVEFSFDNILDVRLIDPEFPGEYREQESRYPQVPDRREYWERCLVDECVLYEGVPVEYIYREQPEPQEDNQYPDSGWRIRGRQASGSDSEISLPKAVFVALGAVLNKDDSWLHLIDEPIGSAFLRKFETGTYEVVT